MKYYIKFREWKHISNTLRATVGLHTRNEKKLRRFVEAVWYINRTGCQCRLLPRYYGRWRSVHARFRSWRERGIWKILFELTQKDPDDEVFMIDATI